MDKTLNHHDVTEITEKLLKVQTKSKVLGQLLKLPPGSVEAIIQQYRNPQDQLLHVIEEFVKQVEPRPTWRVILEALRKKLIGDHRLAQDIKDSISSSCSSLASSHKSVAKDVKAATLPSPSSKRGVASGRKKPTSTVRASRPGIHSPASRTSFKSRRSLAHAPAKHMSKLEAATGARLSEPKQQLWPQGAESKIGWPQNVSSEISKTKGTSSMAKSRASTSSSATSSTSADWYDLDKIKEDIKKLEDLFQILKEEVRNSFQEQQIEVDDIVYKLTDLPAAEKSQHKFFIDKKLQELERCTKHKPLFSRLNGYWNYLSPQLLYHLITTFFPSLKSLLEDKESYDTDLSGFRNLTLLRLFCEIDNEYIEPPEGFSKIVAKFESNVTEDPTLQHVEDFRDRYARHHRLRDFALMLAARGETGSFIVSFVIPNSIIEILEENIPTDLLQEFGVTQLTIADKCFLYPDYVGIAVGIQSVKTTHSSSLHPPTSSSEVPEVFPLVSVSAFSTTGPPASPLTPLQTSSTAGPPEFLPTLSTAEFLQTSSTAGPPEFLPTSSTAEFLQTLSTAGPPASSLTPLQKSSTAGPPEFLPTSSTAEFLQTLSTTGPPESPLTPLQTSSTAGSPKFLPTLSTAEFLQTLSTTGPPESPLTLTPLQTSSTAGKYEDRLEETSEIQSQEVTTEEAVPPVPGILAAFLVNKKDEDSDDPSDDEFSAIARGGQSIDDTIQLEESYHFVEEPSDDYFCPILTVLLLEPHLTACCGQHLSERAVVQLNRRGVPCPMCKNTLLTMKDIYFRRQVRELPVFCPNKNRGCEWVAEVSALEGHVQVCPKKFKPGEAGINNVKEESGDFCLPDKSLVTHTGTNFGKGLRGKVIEVAYTGSTIRAAKKYYHADAATLLKDFGQEKQLSSIRHSHLVAYCGVGLLTVDHFPVVLMERMAMNLKTFLEKGSLPLDRKFKMVYEVLQGLNHLHSLSIVHGGLNEKNVLLSSREVVKIADFGNSYLATPILPSAAKLPLLKYMPPERMALQLDGGDTHPLYEIVTKCLSNNKDSRPSCQDILRSDAFSDPFEGSIDNAVVSPTGLTLGQGVYGRVLEVKYKTKTYAAKKYLCSTHTLSPVIGMIKIRHPNILPYYGIGKLSTDGSAVLVMRRIQINLTSFLQKEITLQRKVEILNDVANGLQVLHSQTPAVFHRNLTANNVFLDINGRARIGDFANASIVASPILSATDYMSPEALKGEEYNDKTDTFSFGHLSIHVITQHRPILALQGSEHKVGGRVLLCNELARRKPYLDEMMSKLEHGVNNPLYQLTVSCLQDKPSKRPSSCDIVEIFSNIMDEFIDFASTLVHPTGVILGQGAYGIVMEVECKGKVYAAKKCHRVSSVAISKNVDLRKEHKILTQIKHPNIVSRFGLSNLATDKSIVIVMPRMEKNLTKFLDECPGIHLIRKNTILFDIAKGLHHLHSQRPAIIHRDLTTGNVLLDSNGTAKISDFGNSRMVDVMATPELLTTHPGTLDYMPPEALAGGEYNDRLDMFSFGHLSIYAIIQRRPHPLLSSSYKNRAGYLIARTEVERRQDYLNEVKSILEGGDKHPLYRLIIKCLQLEPSARPSSKDALNSVIKSITKEVENRCTVPTTVPKPRKSSIPKNVVAITPINLAFITPRDISAVASRSLSSHKLTVRHLRDTPSTRPSSRDDLVSVAPGSLQRSVLKKMPFLPISAKTSIPKNVVAITPINLAFITPRDISAVASRSLASHKLTVRHLRDTPSTRPSSRDDLVGVAPGSLQRSVSKKLPSVNPPISAKTSIPKNVVAIKPINLVFVTPRDVSAENSFAARSLSHNTPSRRPSSAVGPPATGYTKTDVAYLPNVLVHPTGHVLGQGAYGYVLEVEYKGMVYAAKKYRIAALGNAALGAFSREHDILSRIRHPNIVSYYGISKLALDRSTVLVMERMEKNLGVFLKEGPNVTLERKIQILNDVAKGLHHLHSQTPAIIHRDLTASNVLLDSNGTAKISDFGNSRIYDLQATPELLTSNPGILDYMPPEALAGEEYNEKIDVFSFGHLSIYVILQRRPHPLLASCKAGELIARTEVGRRQRYLNEVMSTLECGDEHPLYKLIIKCLQLKPNQRPSCADILEHSPFDQLSL